MRSLTQRLTSHLSALTLTALTALSFTPHTAQALPLINTGLKAGVGMGLGGPDPVSASYMAFGPSARLDLIVAHVELSALYMKQNLEADLGSFGKAETDLNLVSIPLIARVDISPVPGFKLSLGGGLGIRYNLDAEDGQESTSEFVPVSVCADVSMPLIGTVGAEARFNYNLADVDEPMHEGLLFVHAYF